MRGELEVAVLGVVVATLGLVGAPPAAVAETPSVRSLPATAVLAPADAKNTEERSVWIVQLDQPSLASYRGGVAGLAPTHPGSTGARKLDVASPAATAYRAYLRSFRERLLEEAAGSVGRQLTPRRELDVALHAFSVELSSAEAQLLATLPGVKRVTPDVLRQPLTDRGPTWIGAPGLWDGSATGGLPGTKGEGVIVGMLDTGVNPDHPSFADLGGDGYDHVNPFGAGVYKGVCASNPGWGCNDKLIGAYDYTGVAPGPRDDDGHGSHTASTAAGNVLVQRTLVAPTISFDFDLSGVAPHANLIVYDVCDAEGCSSENSAAAVDQAVADGVDVVNYSISGGGDPYGDPVSQAFLGARDAGVVVSAAAGNEGPNAESVGHREPWLLSVGASSHDRAFRNLLVNLAGGDTDPPADIVGRGITSDWGPAPIVYAGDFDDPLCLDEFPPGTWEEGEIVVCDRGVNARVEKGANVLAGGAGGMVLANDDDDGASIHSDGHVLPAVHVTYVDGENLKAWLASGSGHTATITGCTVKVDAVQGDVMSAFSSRGPAFGLDVLKPDLVAPGIDILAASDGNTDSGFDPDELEVMAGTSMATPHVTGAATLLRALHPAWSPGQLQSALMTTATTAVVKEDLVTPADPFDFGSGRVDLTQAGQAGLLLDETRANFDASDPALGGDPTTLNLPSLATAQCPGSCSFTRTLRSSATTSTVWRAHLEVDDPGLVVTVTPSTLSLPAGGSAPFVADVDASRLELDAWHFGALVWTEASGSAPPARLPLVIGAASTSSPTMFTKKVDHSEAEPGETLTYVLTATNAEYTSQTFAIADPVPDNTTYVPGSATNGLVYNAGSDSLTWSGSISPATFHVDASSAPQGYVSLAGLGVQPYPCSSDCDELILSVELPGFHFWHAGVRYDSLAMVTNGLVVPGNPSTSGNWYTNQHFPSTTDPDNVIAPLWKDFDLDGTSPTDPGGGHWYGAILEYGSTRYLVLEWEQVKVYQQPSTSFTFQLWVEEDTANIWFVYHQLTGTLSPATVGVENAAGTAGVNYYYNGTGTAPAVGTDLLVSTQEGQSKVFTFQATVDADSPDPVVNRADLTRGTTTTSAWIATLLPSSLQADLTLSLDATSPQIVNEPFSYTIQVDSNGPVNGTGVVVSDHLPAGLVYLSDTCGGGIVAGEWTWAVGTAGVDLPVTCQLEVVPRFVGSVVNSAAVAGDQEDPNPANNTDNAQVQVTAPSLLFADGFESGNTSGWSSTLP